MIDLTPLLREPSQARSRKTLERFVEASGRLLRKSNWADISVVQLAAEAGSSVGAFYTRFRDKDALLDYLDELYAVDFIELFGRFAAETTDLTNLHAKVELLVQKLGGFYRERLGVARALVLRARLLREPAYEERTNRMNDALASVYEAMLFHTEEIEHQDASRAVFFAFSLVFFSLRERILFAETIQDRSGVGDDDLEIELTRAAMSYLSPSSQVMQETR